jgi:hypothetical protein
MSSRCAASSGISRVRRTRDAETGCAGDDPAPWVEAIRQLLADRGV